MIDTGAVDERRNNLSKSQQAMARAFGERAGASKRRREGEGNGR